MNLFEAKERAEALMSKHGLISQGWRFKYDNSKRRFGVCKYRLKIIGLSQHLVALNDEKKVVDTILHEIAHALTPGHHHDSVWRAKAIEIGCDGNRCYDSDIVETPESKYISECSGCGRTHKRHKRPPVRNQSCGYCSNGRYNPTYKLEWKINPKF